MTRWLLSIARRCVPTEWREAIVRDLDDEAIEQKRGQLWITWQTLCAGVRLRFAFSDDGIVSDVRMVVRSLMRSKGFTAAAILTFALGIGVNIAVFSVIDRLMFRPLPYPDPDRLVQIHLLRARDPAAGAFAMLPVEVTAHLKESSASIEDLGWVDYDARVSVPAPGENPLRLIGVTPNALAILGIGPVLGRDFTAGDAAAPWFGEAAVLLMHETWKSRFGSSTDVLSKSWGAKPAYRVVGVLPPGFILPTSRLLEKVDGLFVLSDEQTRAEAFRRPGSVATAPFARLLPGATIASAQAELDVLMAQPSWASDILQGLFAKNASPLTVQPLRSGITMFLGSYLWLIAGAVWIVLCAACVNLTTLLLARGRSRQREAAIRAAIGASPGRLVRLALVESIVVCVAASLVALLVCVWTEAALLSVVPPAFGAFAVPPLDVRIVATTIGAAFISAAIAGVLPALSVARVDVLAVLQKAGRTTRLTSLRGGASLLTLEAAFGVALVIGGAMVVPGFVKLVAGSPGFDARDLFVLNVPHGGPNGHPSADDHNRLQRVWTMLDVLRQTPRIEHAAAALTLPFGGVPGHREFWDQRGLTGNVWAVSSGLFETLRTPLLAGRAFSDADIDTDARVAIVSATAAKALWPGEPIERAVNKTIETESGARMVVGVVGDLRTAPPAVPEPALYLPIATRELHARTTTLPVVVRMAPDAIPDPAFLATRLNERFPPAARVTVTSVRDQLAPMLDRPRFLAVLMGGLAGVALLLVAVGLYALASFEVARRRYEIGVRLSLGSSVRAIRRRILRLALVPVLVGSAVGSLVVWWSAALTQNAVAEIDPRDPWAYAGAGLFMMTAAMLAAALPAYRAGKIDPVTVLRES